MCSSTWRTPTCSPAKTWLRLTLRLLKQVDIDRQVELAVAVNWGSAELVRLDESRRS